MDRLQPLRAFGSDRGVSPVEVRRREVSDGFGAREGENKGETKGEIIKGKSCTTQEDKKQNQQTSFHDLDATPRPGIEEAQANSSDASDEGEGAKPSTTKQLAEGDSIGQRRKVEAHKAQEGPTESSFSTLQRSVATNVCEGRREATAQLEATKRLLRDFTLTLVFARPEFFQTAIANVKASYARQIERHLRSLDGKNLKKKTAATLTKLCDDLFAEAIAEREANLCSSPPARHESDTDHEDTGDDEHHHNDAADEHDAIWADRAEEEWY